MSNKRLEPNTTKLRTSGDLMKEGYLESRGDVSVARIYSSRKVILAKLVKFLWSIE